MKKLISALTVKQAHKDGKDEISAPPATTIVTPEALTVAKELHVRIVESADAVSPKGAETAGKAKKVDIDEALVRTVVERVIRQLPAEKRQPQVIRDVVTEVLLQYGK